MSKRPYLDKSYPAVDPNGDLAPLELDADGNLKTVVDAITIDNDASHPVPVTSTQIGEVQASPTANTVLDRLKTLATLIGEVQASPTSNTLLDRVKNLSTLLSGGLPAALSAGGGVKVGLVDELPAGTKSIGAVSSNSVVSSATVTRPADTTAYAAKDVISTAVGAVIEFTGMARANAGTGTIVRARLMTSQKTNVALYRLHLFHTAPTAIADNSPYLLLYANAANRIGSIDFPALGTEDSTNSTAAAGMRPSYDGSYNAPNLWYKCKSDGTSLYGMLETLSAFTPDSAQVFFIELGADGLS